jgi:hypothetical protein
MQQDFWLADILICDGFENRVVEINPALRFEYPVKDCLSLQK